MFIVARFPIGRKLGSFFYRDVFFARAQGNWIAPAAKDNLSCKINNEENAVSIFKDLDIEQAVVSIRENGYYLGIKLPQNILQEILEFAYSAEICVDDNPQLKFKYAEIKQATAKYKQKILIGNYLNASLKCSALKRLENDPKLRAIAAKYLGKAPLLVRSQMGWCFLGEKKEYSKKGARGNPLVLFHYDLDDYRALKFFFYLTDVDSLSGSHICVASSHKKRKLLHYILRSQSDLDIKNYYGLENIVKICGPAGFGFAEDPFCFHRGTPPVNSPRLMIQLEFAFNDYGMWN